MILISAIYTLLSMMQILFTQLTPNIIAVYLLYTHKWTHLYHLTQFYISYY
jgi:hypothetical protein